MPTIGEAIRCSLWARSLAPDQLARVEATVVELFVPANGFVCRKGEPVESWLGVIEGLVKLGGFRNFTGAIVPAGGWFAEGSLLKDKLFKYDGIALRDSRIARVPRETFEWLLETSIGFSRFLLHQLNERLGQFIAITECDRVLDPDTRVARSLATMFNPYLYPGIENRLQLSQEEIGRLSGVSRQRANQALQVLEKAGILKVDYGRVTVLDVEALRSFGV